jgi:hypothetical protein
MFYLLESELLGYNVHYMLKKHKINLRECTNVHLNAQKCAKRSGFLAYESYKNWPRFAYGGYEERV